MILIGGTSLQVEQLPLAEMLEYVLTSDDMDLDIKLKTTANKEGCFKVYLHTRFEDKPMSDKVKEKCVFYTSDEELIQFLENGDENAPSDVIENVSEEKEETEDNTLSFSNESSEEIIKLIDEGEIQESVFSEDTLYEVDAELESEFLVIPNVSEDIDNLKVLVKNKDSIIEQKNMQIKELARNREEMFDLQQQQLEDMREIYDGRINELISQLDLAKDQLSQSNIDEDSAKFLKFATYCKNYSVLLNEGLSEQEKNTLGSANLSNFYVYTCGGGDSYFSMMRRIKSLADRNQKVILVDFSNSPYLSSACKLTNNRLFSTHLNRDDIPVTDIVRDLGNTKIFPTQSYNDIGLLGMDWGKILKKLSDYSSGYPVILLFNSINSFNVRYTISKLATVTPLFIFAKCNPLILSSLSTDIKFIPENRARIVATEYIDVVSQMIDVLSKKYKVIGFKDNTDWKSLGLKF